jgi:hypothetical protein
MPFLRLGRCPDTGRPDRAGCIGAIGSVESTEMLEQFSVTVAQSSCKSGTSRF